MIRAILFLIASVLAITVLRAVLGMIARLFTETFASSSSSSTAGPQRPAAPVSEALKKDPVCGTFIAPSAAVQKSVKGTVYYFCSNECRDKFA